MARKGSQQCDAKTHPQQSGFAAHCETGHLFRDLGLAQQAPRTIAQAAGLPPEYRQTCRP
jgi:hypothetical protein